MEVQEALLKRRSVRKFTAEKVSKEDIDVLLHAAMSGPSACNKLYHHVNMMKIVSIIFKG